MSLLTLSLVVVLVGLFFGLLGSVIPFGTGWRRVNAIAIFSLAFVSVALVTRDGFLIALSILTFFTGWLSAVLILFKIDDGFFEESSIAAAISVVVAPPVLVGLGWLFVVIVTSLLQLGGITISIEVVADPVLKHRALGIVLGIWASAIGAYPLAYLEARREVMFRRRPR